MNNQTEDTSLVTTDELLWDTAVATALELPGSEIYPFAFEWEAARVCGKWFMISTVRNTRIVNLKADPLDVIALCDNFEPISPGYHTNKKHWVTVAPGDDLTVGMIKDLVVESYRLVVASLPQRERPINPKSFTRS